MMRPLATIALTLLVLTTALELLLRRITAGLLFLTASSAVMVPG